MNAVATTVLSALLLAGFAAPAAALGPVKSKPAPVAPAEPAVVPPGPVAPDDAAPAASDPEDPAPYLIPAIRFGRTPSAAPTFIAPLPCATPACVAPTAVTPAGEAVWVFGRRSRTRCTS
jgi:hypothetical protein